MPTSPVDLKGMPLAELERFFAQWGKERYRARQVSRWLYNKFADDFAVMTDLSREFRALLSSSCRVLSTPAQRLDASSDGTEKALFRFEDGAVAESVLIPDEDRRTLCISSQSGCALRCLFCATATMGFHRDLTSSEIVHQVCFFSRRLALRGEKLSNVVFMGMGEPLLNLTQVSRAIDILLSQYGFGLSGKRVTVSTVGIVPEMLSLSAKYPVSFAVSLNASREDLRSILMPINRKHSLKETIAAMRKIPLQSGRKVTAEYVLIADVNDTPRDAAALAGLLKGARIKVNLIPFNEHGKSSYRAPRPETVDGFRDILLAQGIQAITRERRGADIAAACGQLCAEI